MAAQVVAVDHDAQALLPCDGGADRRAHQPVAGAVGPRAASEEAGPIRATYAQGEPGAGPAVHAHAQRFAGIQAGCQDLQAYLERWCREENESAARGRREMAARNVDPIVGPHNHGTRVTDGPLE